jgi:polyphosphate glucokinase
MAVLGIDVGGSGIKGALVDLDTGEFLTDRYRIPTPEDARPDEVAEVVKQIVEYFEYQGPVGCGFPAVVRNGVTWTASNISETWIGADAAGLFTQATGQPVYVVNDADAAGLAEMRFGAGKDEMGVVMVLTLGTGVGSAIFVNGHLLPNTEFGQLVIRGKFAEKRSSDAARQRKDWTYEKWATKVQEHLSQLEALMSPDLFIIGGGVSKNADEFFPFLKLRARLVTAQLLNQAGIVGAALFAAQMAGVEMGSPLPPIAGSALSGQNSIEDIPLESEVEGGANGASEEE